MFLIIHPCFHAATLTNKNELKILEFIPKYFQVGIKSINIKETLRQIVQLLLDLKKCVGHFSDETDHVDLPK